MRTLKILLGVIRTCGIRRVVKFVVERIQKKQFGADKEALTRWLIENLPENIVLDSSAWVMRGCPDDNIRVLAALVHFACLNLGMDKIKSILKGNFIKE